MSAYEVRPLHFPRGRQLSVVYGHQSYSSADRCFVFFKLSDGWCTTIDVRHIVEPYRTRFYTSGLHEARFATLNEVIEALDTVLNANEHAGRE